MLLCSGIAKRRLTCIQLLQGVYSADANRDHYAYSTFEMAKGPRQDPGV